MKSIARAIALGSFLSMTACNNAGSEKAAESTKAAAEDPHGAFTNVSVDEVASMLKDKSCVPIDANKPETRSEYGTLPGAVLLSDYSRFDTSELPADKNVKLVFYCGSTKCTAAPKAATVAQRAGYTNITVMRDGIRGWVNAGHQVDKPST